MFHHLSSILSKFRTSNSINNTSSVELRSQLARVDLVHLVLLVERITFGEEVGANLWLLRTPCHSQCLCLFQ